MAPFEADQVVHFGGGYLVEQHGGGEGEQGRPGRAYRRARAVPGQALEREFQHLLGADDAGFLAGVPGQVVPGGAGFLDVLDVDAFYVLVYGLGEPLHHFVRRRLPGFIFLEAFMAAGRGAQAEIQRALQVPGAGTAAFGAVPLPQPAQHRAAGHVVHGRDLVPLQLALAHLQHAVDAIVAAVVAAPVADGLGEIPQPAVGPVAVAHILVAIRYRPGQVPLYGRPQVVFGWLRLRAFLVHRFRGYTGGRGRPLPALQDGLAQGAAEVFEFAGRRGAARRAEQDGQKGECGGVHKLS
ncbi:MAG: hypothetical protein CVU79_03585 [Elusimicrobia bacterium HGW-Elusimicrobia-3]|nr:MAG: hypothetical protein CVU79_03585 [Elusimicrobia bacterium HGW-Elusimicrobia-3]